MFDELIPDYNASLSSAFLAQGPGLEEKYFLSPLGQSLAPPKTIAFVDSAVSNVDQLFKGINADVIVLLQPGQDGITQITERLSDFDQITGIHIFSHGSSGQIQLGDTIVDNQRLNDRGQELLAWADSLAPNADILLYGCDVAAGLAGSTFISRFGQLTGADIAASTGLTGNLELGGDWSLEASTGAIESASPIHPTLITSYTGLLASIDFATFSDTSSLRLNGSAARFGSALRLTPAASNRAGSAFFTTPIEIDTNTSFQTQFQFQLTGGTSSADGVVFMLQNSPAGVRARGGTGGDLGYSSSGVTGISQSLAIKFDTWRNSEDRTSNSIAVLRDGKRSALAATSTGLPDLNSGGLINAWIDYNGINNRLDVFVSTTTTKPTTAALTYEALELESVLGSRAFVGFSAGTGARFNAQDITSWTFNSSTEPVSTFALKDSKTILVNEGAGLATVTVVRDIAQNRATLEYTTNGIGEEISATADVDYITPTFNGRPNTGQVVFEIGETEKSFTIPIVNDGIIEGNETFAIGIQNPSGGTLGAPRTALITIVDDDEPGIFSLSQPTITEPESAPTVAITVQRSGNVAGTSSVTYSTVDGTAIAGADYTATSGTLFFAAGETTQTFSIPILKDTLSEGTEAFSVILSNPTNTLLDLAKDTTIVTILDDDLPGTNTEGLIGYWRFEELGNPIADSSGSDNNGSLVNAATVNSEMGRSLRVSGRNNSHASIPWSLDSNSIADQITVMGWLKPTRLTSRFQAAINKQIRNIGHPDSLYLGFGPRFFSDGILTFKWEITTVPLRELAIYEGIPIANRWVHMAGTYDGTQLRLYVDGNELLPTALGFRSGAGAIGAGTIVMDDNPITLGGAENGPTAGLATSDTYAGLIDEVRIYNRALSMAEIGEIYELNKLDLLLDIE